MSVSLEAVPPNSLSVKVNGLDDWYNLVKCRILEKVQIHLNTLKGVGNLHFCILYKLLDIVLGACKKILMTFFF